jgi:prephenate dehydrogenase
MPVLCQPQFASAASFWQFLPARPILQLSQIRMSQYRNVAIVGVGLIGGSIGLGLRKRGLAASVTGVGRRQQSLDKALNVGAINHATLDLEAAVAKADLVVVATPVGSVTDDVCRAVAAAPRAQLVTDVGSTKGIICHTVEERLAGQKHPFVGSHPLAGDHRTGPEHARSNLLEGRTVVVTPTATTDPAVVATAQQFWQSLGAVVRIMAPEEHDRALAATSHLPHLLASALAAGTPLEWLPLAATGWADTTRIASGDAELWTQIFAQNGPAVGEALDTLLQGLAKLRDQMASEDWASLRDTLLQGKQIRDALGN